MTFENVDIESLRIAINACIETLNIESLTELENSLSNICETEAGKHLNKSINKLINVRYKELKDYLEKCNNIVNYIEEYKKLELENIELQKQYENLQMQLTGNEIVDNITKEQMLNISEEIEANILEMETLVSNVSSMI